VVYDLGQNYHDGLHLVALRRCTLNLIVATAEKSTANEMEQAVKDLKACVNYSDIRFRLVLNKWDDRLGVDAREVVERLGLSEYGRVPYGSDMKVDLSLNYSKPMVLEKPNEVSEAIIALISGFYSPIEKMWQQKGGAKRKRGFELFGRR
ncbi:MAG: hypothetical protein HC853_14910, partial [Anaerolineae bacterium]|nr:hypothetical protein [Anaerolineae bacterium]